MPVKHWVGTITTRSFAEIPTVPVPGTDPLKVIHDNKTFQKILQWGLSWQQKAMKAENADRMLVVFEIPIAAEIELTAAIDQFLQTRNETKRLKDE